MQALLIPMMAKMLVTTPGGMNLPRLKRKYRRWLCNLSNSTSVLQSFYILVWTSPFDNKEDEWWKMYLQNNSQDCRRCDIGFDRSKVRLVLEVVCIKVVRWSIPKRVV